MIDEVSNPLLSAALQYAAQGLPVLPLKKQDKKPYTPHGFKDASNDPLIIEKWWTTWPDANIGIATGTLSGLAVLDVDVKNGQPGKVTLLELQKQHGPLATRKCRTPSGGVHLYFKCPENGVPSSIGFMPGLDFRGDGGYVVSPPSRIEGMAYKWEDEDVSIAELPSWLHQLLLTKDKSPAKSFDVDHAMAGVSIGQRNDMIFRFACSLRARRVKKKEARPAVLESAGNCQPPLDTAEAIACLDSAYKYSPPLEEFSDMGNARRLINWHGASIRYVHDLGRWYIWDGRRWAEDRAGEIMRLAKETVNLIPLEADDAAL